MKGQTEAFVAEYIVTIIYKHVASIHQRKDWLGQCVYERVLLCYCPVKCICTCLPEARKVQHKVSMKKHAITLMCAICVYQGHEN